MLVSRIDYNLLSDVITFKETVKQSVEALMDEKITASHLVTDVHALLDLLDMLENEWRGTPPVDDVTGAAATPPGEEAQAEQPAVEAEQPPAEVEQPPAEAEQPPAEVEQPPAEVEQPSAEAEQPPAEDQ